MDKRIEFETSGPYAEVEWVEHNNGYFTWLKGYPYPVKGWPRKDAMEEVNNLKRGRQVDWNIFELVYDNMCPFARAWWSLTGSREFAHIFQYDEAYRFRLQDLFAETTVERLSLWPCAEILRLLEINRQRDHKFAHRKFILAAYALVLFFLWPPNRKKFREALSRIDYKQLLPDEGDLYWMSKKIDYKYGGR